MDGKYTAKGEGYGVDETYWTKVRYINECAKLQIIFSLKYVN